MATAEPPSDGSKGDRIAKVLARAGLCSRRDAERWIAEGRVRVNGRVLDTPACVVGPADQVVVDGKPLPAADRTRLWRFHKPAGVVTTHRDPQGRPTLFDILPPELPRVVSVGRLDLNSEGLILLTNDGALARRMELPSTGWVRRYRVRVHGYVDPAKLASLEGGVTVDGIAYGPIRATLDNQKGENAWLTVSLREGKNREIRRVMEHIGYLTNRLIRVAYGPFQLGELERGAADEVPGKVLRDQMGAAPEAAGSRSTQARASPVHTGPSPAPSRPRSRPPRPR